jgi:Tol biopolymer transport system component
MTNSADGKRILEFPRRSHVKLKILVAVLVFGAVSGTAAFAADSGAELFQKAVTQERAAGNLEEAIKLYQRVAKELASGRPLAAKALVQAAHCYELLGQDKQDKAVKLYEQVTRDFGDQRELSAAANSRLAVLRQVERTPAPATMTQRRLELPYPAELAYPAFATDGKREVYRDAATGALMFSDLAGKEKRVILKPKAGEQVNGILPSRDFSIVATGLIRADGSRIGAVIKADGTGYRELTNSVCVPDWSWDNRFLLFCQRQPDGTRQLVRVSVTDGEIRKVQQTDGDRFALSPDGRFIAIADLGAVRRLGKISVVPSQGGPPQLVADNARLMDWTRDGRYLAIVSQRSSSPEALYLLPMKDGQAAGDPVFVRYGSFTSGRTISDGSLVYQSTPAAGGNAAWFGTPDADGRSLDWKPLRLSGSLRSSFMARWSPDSTQIVYSSPDEAIGQNAWVIRLRNMASGDERELYRGGHAVCIWAAQRDNLVCAQENLTPPFSIDILSISIDSGRVESLASEKWGNGGAFFSSPDDKAIYMWRMLGQQPVPELIRWDIGTRQATVVDRIPGPVNSGDWPGPDPDKHWIARRNKEKLEIRPMSGGDWKPLISLDTTQAAFSPDGNWLLYHDVDVAGKQSLFRVSTAGGQPERIGAFPSAGKTGSLRISPDGQKIIAEAAIAPEVWILENFEPKQQAAK